MNIVERQTSGEYLISIINANFNHYLVNGKILIGGSFFYQYFFNDIEIKYKDLDIIIDTQSGDDSIVQEIYDFFINSDLNINTIRSRTLNVNSDGTLSATIHFDDQISIDLLRNDLSDSVPYIEIIKDISCNYQSPKSLKDVYKAKTPRTKKQKNKDLFEADQLVKTKLRTYYDKQKFIDDVSIHNSNIKTIDI